MTRTVLQLRPARPEPLSDLTFRWERFGNIAGELTPLFKANWRELALYKDDIPLDPDWDRYFLSDVGGLLRILTARANGELVGYIFNFLSPLLHYVSTITATVDIFWLHPDFRHGWTPVRMFRENMEGLKEQGAKVHTINFKLHFKNARGRGVGKLLSRLGYKPIEIVMQKRL